METPEKSQPSHRDVDLKYHPTTSSPLKGTFQTHVIMDNTHSCDAKTPTIINPFSEAFAVIHNIPIGY